MTYIYQWDSRRKLKVKPGEYCPDCQAYHPLGGSVDHGFSLTDPTTDLEDDPDATLGQGLASKEYATAKPDFRPSWQIWAPR